MSRETYVLHLNSRCVFFLTLTTQETILTAWTCQNPSKKMEAVTVTVTCFHRFFFRSVCSRRPALQVSTPWRVVGTSLAALLVKVVFLFQVHVQHRLAGWQMTCTPYIAICAWKLGMEKFACIWYDKRKRISRYIYIYICLFFDGYLDTYLAPFDNNCVYRIYDPSFAGWAPALKQKVFTSSMWIFFKKLISPKFMAI